MKRVSIVGMGAVGRSIVEAWWKHPPIHTQLSSVCVRPHQLGKLRQDLPDAAIAVTDIQAVLEAGTDIVIEAAGHAATLEIAAPVLRSGCDLYLLSVGVLADAAAAADIKRASDEGGGQVVIVPGALAGFDGLMAMRRTGLDRVKYTSVKPCLAWSGTPADEKFRLAELKQRTTIFEGSARDAARLFPKNANLAAAVALAGRGFDKTEIELIADPDAAGNTGIVEAYGPGARLHVELSGDASPDNPKTSAIVSASVLAALDNRAATTRFL